MKINRALSIVLAALMVIAMLPTFAFASPAGTVTIAGNSSFVSAPAGTYSKLAYTAAYSDGQVVETNPKAFSWEVTEDGAPATDVWCVDGEFIVSGGAAGTYKIVATHKATGTKSADFPVVITASTLYDWDNNKPVGYENVKLTEKANGDTYYNANVDISAENYHLSSGSDVGIKTLELEFKVSSDGFSSNKKTLVGDTSGWKGPIGVRNAANLVSDGDFILTAEAGSYSPVCDVLGNYKNLNYDTWYDLCVVFDIPASSQDIPEITALYLDGEYCKTWSVSGKKVNDSVALYDGVIEKLRFYPHCDDIVMYSGAPYSPEPEIEETGVVYVPQTAGVKNYVQLSASSIVGSEGVTWSIPATTGVSIDADTGLVTVTNEAVSGTVKVTATQAGAIAEADLVLKVINEDFEANGNHGSLGNGVGAPWFYSVVASDGADNQYAAYDPPANAAGYIGRYFTHEKAPESDIIDVSSIASDESTVIEFKFKGSTVFVLQGDGTDSKIDQINLGDSEEWTTAKLVYSNTKNASGKYTVTAFVDGKLHTYNKELQHTSYPSKRFEFRSKAIDDFKLYGADFASPEAHDATLTATAPGSELALSYKYFNEGGVAETGTEIVWSYADSKDSANWTALTQFNNKTAVDASTTATLKGKYVKAVVTPKTVNPYTNEAVAGTPAEAVALIDDVVFSSECIVDGSSFDIDSDSLQIGKTLSYTFSANQIQETAETYMVVAAKYTADGGELLSADAKDLTTEKGVKKSITVSSTKTEDSIIKVFVFKKADISPVIYNLVK